MRKKSQVKEDGRYIVFYDLAEESKEEPAEERETSSEKGGER